MEVHSVKCDLRCLVVVAFVSHVRRSLCTGYKLETSVKCLKRWPKAWIPISRTRRQEVSLGDAS